MFNTKARIVNALCPRVFVTKQMKELDNLGIVLDEGLDVCSIGNKFVCKWKKKTFEFTQPPTETLYAQLAEAPLDMVNQVAVVENKLLRLKMAAAQSRACRLPVAPEIEVPCKSCGGTEYINCVTHYTCTKCAVVRTMVHAGLTYREMAERTEDLNGCSQQKDSLLSDAWHGRSFPQGAESKTLTSLQNAARNLAADPIDGQVAQARVALEDVCADLLIAEGVAKKAHVLFCRLRNTEARLLKTNVLYAACLFSALQKPVVRRIAPKRKRSNQPPTTPLKRLPVISFKTPVKKKLVQMQPANVAPTLFILNIHFNRFTFTHNFISLLHVPREEGRTNV